MSFRIRLRPRKSFESSSKADQKVIQKGILVEAIVAILGKIVGIIIIIIGLCLIFTKSNTDISVSNFSAMGAKLGEYKGPAGVFLIILGGVIAYFSQTKIKLK